MVYRLNLVIPQLIAIRCNHAFTAAPLPRLLTAARVSRICNEPDSETILGSSLARGYLQLLVGADPQGLSTPLISVSLFGARGGRVFIPVDPKLIKTSVSLPWRSFPILASKFAQEYPSSSNRELSHKDSWRDATISPLTAIVGKLCSCNFSDLRVRIRRRRRLCCL